MKREKDRYEVILAGSGGQGVVLAAIMLAEAAILEGRTVVQTQSYGVASRGGLSLAEVIVDRQEIVFQQVQEPDVILALTGAALQRCAARAAAGTPILYDATLAQAASGRNLTGRPFTKTAAELGSAGSVAVVGLGALIAAIPVVRAESLAEAIRQRFRGKALETNLRALEAGAALVAGRNGPG